MKPISYEKAGPGVRAVFDDIKTTRKIADVNNFWKYLAKSRGCFPMSGRA